MPHFDLEKACRKICPHCRKAEQMKRKGEQGHTLRKRNDTGEWVHDFLKGVMFTHGYCLGTKLRNDNG